MDPIHTNTIIKYDDRYVTACSNLQQVQSTFVLQLFAQFL